MSEFSKEFVKDIANRTKQNLEVYNGEYDVTQLINSAVGLIMIPHQRYYAKIDNSFISATTLQKLRNSIEQNTYPEDGSVIELRDIVKHIRNGIAHSAIYFESENSQLIRVKIEDHRKKYTYKNTTKPAADFKIILNISELRAFMIEFSDAIISNKLFK